MSETKICDQCSGDYEPGTGATERGPCRYQLMERFCSEECAARYDIDFFGDYGQATGQPDTKSDVKP